MSNKKVWANAAADILQFFGTDLLSDLVLFTGVLCCHGTDQVGKLVKRWLHVFHCSSVVVFIYAIVGQYEIERMEWLYIVGYLMAFGLQIFVDFLRGRNCVK